jgi:hypothetical protein
MVAVPYSYSYFNKYLVKTLRPRVPSLLCLSNKIKQHKMNIKDQLATFKFKEHKVGTKVIVTDKYLNQV